MTAPSGCWGCGDPTQELGSALIHEWSHEVHLYCDICVNTHGDARTQEVTDEKQRDASAED